MSRNSRFVPTAHSFTLLPFWSGQALLMYSPFTYRSRPLWPTVVMWCIVEVSGFCATTAILVESVLKRIRPPEGCWASDHTGGGDVYSNHGRHRRNRDFASLQHPTPTGKD